MAEYKGVEFVDELIECVRTMPDVEDYRDVLARLQGSWDTLTMLGQLSGSAAEMSGTREAFAQLTGKLLNLLASETLDKRVADLRAKAQNSIDILVRNLFERTADIGFLAADTEVEQFLVGEQDDGARQQLRRRFREYVLKYSVYSEIVLFDTEGRVVASLSGNQQDGAAYAFAGQVMASTAPFTEVFGPQDFLPAGPWLVYAHKVVSGARTCGALALVFRLEDELDGIYRRLLASDDWVVLAIADAEGRVVATSSGLQLPVGCRLPEGLVRARGDVVRFAGRRSLAFSCRPVPYQGYPGPGWIGLALIPLEFAFESVRNRHVDGIDKEALGALMSQSPLFPDVLREIPRRAAAIQQNLNRSVWNGSIRQSESDARDASFAKTLLWEVSDAGRRTQDVFEQAIGNLQETVMAALLDDVSFRSAFAIDVMDRNLFERANDCRWWALDGTFRRELARGAARDAASCATTLRLINDLYTVYETLILFDAQGVVVAVSRPERDAWIGERLSEEWVARTLGLRGTQDYAVSAFAPAPLYADRPTYIYAAAVRDGAQRPVGGVGIVFDSEPQFAAMLGEALPRDDKGRPMAGAFALFTRPDGTVLASSDPALGPGDAAWTGGAFAELAPGVSRSRVVAHGGHHYAIGATMSAGYREFKRQDGYREPVVAVCAVPVGAVAEARGNGVPQAAVASFAALRTQRGPTRSAMLEFATFVIGAQWFGVPSRQVEEAILCDDLRPLPGSGHGSVIGMKLLHGALVPILTLPGVPRGITEPQQAVIIRRADGTRFGLVVDGLADVPEVPAEDVRPLGSADMAANSLASHVVPGLRRADGRPGMLLVLDLERLGVSQSARFTA